MKRILFVFLLLSSVNLYSQLSAVSEEGILNHSTLIVEGKVVAQQTIETNISSLVFMLNKVKVFKVFKGKINAYYVEILTRGGTISGVAMNGEDDFSLAKDDVGIFYLHPQNINIINDPNSGSIIYDVYAGSQGFIKYDLQTKTAATPFISYKNISRNLYPHFEKMTGGYILIDNTFMAEPPKQLMLSKKRLTKNSPHKKSPH